MKNRYNLQELKYMSEKRTENDNNVQEGVNTILNRRKKRRSFPVVFDSTCLFLTKTSVTDKELVCIS